MSEDQREPASENQAETLEPTVSGEPLRVATSVRDAIDGWVTRMAATGGAGRGATMAARMATARAMADLRGLELSDPKDSEAAPVVEYLRRAKSTLSNAAQDIERNRYSLYVMQQQLDRLKLIADRIWPPAQSESEGAAGGADDGGADGEVASSEQGSLQGQDSAE
jgi:hypothetical protein